jgi:DNA-binding transcriptional regulator YhcF (GntR family)
VSVEALAIVLHHSRAKSATSKLVLVGIANHDGDGGSWPAVATLALYAGCSPRTVQRAVDELERLGEIRRVVQAGGTRHTADHRRPNLYEILLRCPPDCDRTKHHRTRRSASVVVDLDGLDAAEEELSTRVTPVSPHPVTPVSPEPSTRTSHNISPRDQPQTAREITRHGWDHPCNDGRTDTHARSARTGACAYCGARETTWTETL